MIELDLFVDYSDIESQLKNLGLSDEDLEDLISCKKHFRIPKKEKNEGRKTSIKTFYYDYISGPEVLNEFIKYDVRSVNIFELIAFTRDVDKEMSEGMILVAPKPIRCHNGKPVVVVIKILEGKVTIALRNKDYRFSWAHFLGVRE